MKNNGPELVDPLPAEGELPDEAPGQEGLF